jgi:hypothetical protein
MLSFFKRVFGSEDAGVIGTPEEAAPDGNRNVLQSGQWAAQPAIPAEAFPDQLVLNQSDSHLAPQGASEIILASMSLGRHQLELLLGEADSDLAMLAVRIPTAANQFKDPYIVMESEHGNTCEDAVREIDFHLRGRIDEKDIQAADWVGFFQTAADKLQGLRGQG